MSTYGIKTRYAGQDFLSLAEARYAAAFDLLGWKWQYEPCEFLGYLPDFWVVPRGAEGFYVEAKGGVHSSKELFAETQKIVTVDRAAFIVGSSPSVCLELHRYSRGGVTVSAWKFPRAWSAQLEAVWTEALQRARWKPERFAARRP